MTALDEYDELDGCGLAELVAKGEVTPLELVEAAIARIESRDAQVNAVVVRQFEQARDLAKGELPDGPFKGVPFLLKDLKNEQAGQLATDGCALRKDYRPARDAELVRRFQQAGVVILGRTSSPEFGIYAVTEPKLYGPCRNPWNLEHTPGGSSGGAAAAVAARMVPLAAASDGGGSIRIPASHCGLVGLKPTRARVPLGPYHGEGWGGNVSSHVVTRSVRDSAAMLDATAGPDVGAPYQVRDPERPYREEVGADPGRLKIGVCTGALFADRLDPLNVQAVEAAAEQGRALGHEVVEAKPDFDRQELTMAYLLTVAAGTAAAVRKAGEIAGRAPRPSDVEAPTWLLKQIGEAVSAAELMWARETIMAESRRVAAFFEDYDVLLTATAAAPPVKVGTFTQTLSERIQLRLLRAVPSKSLLLTALRTMARNALDATPNTMLFNQTGQPAISLPLYWTPDGLPLGTQWVGRFGDEATLFRLAAQLESAHPWGARKPALVEAPTEPAAS